MRISPPEFKRKLVLEENINKSISIEGLRGYVSAFTECCTGQSKAYLPVMVVGVKLGDCSFSVIVKHTATQIFAVGKNEFTINPKHFYQSKEEIQAYENHKETCLKFKNEVRPFDYNHSTLTRCRSLFREALEKTTKELREEILGEISDADEGIKKAPRSWMEEWFKKMMMVKYFPDWVDKEEEEDYDWDDE